MPFNICNSTYQVFLSNTNNSYIAVWFQRTNNNPCKWFNSSNQSIDGTITGIITQDQSGPWSNGNEGVLHIPQTPELEPHHQMHFSVIPRTNCIYILWYLQKIPSKTYSVWKPRLVEVSYMKWYSNYNY